MSVEDGIGIDAAEPHDVEFGFIAEQILKDFVGMFPQKATAQRSEADALLLAAHGHVAAVRARQLQEGRIAG